MRRSLFAFLTAYFLAAAYTASVFYTETLAYIPPKSERADISYIVEKNSLTEEDYDIIFSQTGLGKSAVDSLNGYSELYVYQENYFSAPEFRCSRNSPVSSEEHITSSPVKLAPLEEGDILLTRCSHVLSWRNGHAAIVSSVSSGTTLEAVVIGRNSTTQNISKWTKYPNFMVLRLKDADRKKRAEIASHAMECLNDVPYNVFAGIFPMKYSLAGKTTGTQCAHLIWLAYAHFGYDIDSDKGLIVTPKDIGGSDLFEIVQTYGMG